MCICCSSVGKLSVFSSGWRPLGHVGGRSPPRAPRLSRCSHAFCEPPASTLRVFRFEVSSLETGRAHRLSLVGALGPTRPRRPARGRTRVRKAHRVLRGPPGVRAPPAPTAVLRLPRPGLTWPDCPPPHRAQARLPPRPPSGPIGTGGSDLGSGAEARAHLLHRLLLSGEVVAGICLPQPRAELDQWPSSPM